MNTNDDNPYKPPTEPPVRVPRTREPITWYKFFGFVFLVIVLLVPSILVGAFTTCLTESLIRDEAMGRRVPRKVLSTPEQWAITASFYVGASFVPIIAWMILRKRL